MGKKVDFYLPDQNIVLEFDGDMHINYNRMDISADTGYRNVCYLYGGYKILIITLMDFNANRSKTKLIKLLKHKMGLMEEHKALLVQ